MKRIILAAAIAAACTSSAFSADVERTVAGQAKVIDGDSLVVSGIRILDVDAPDCKCEVVRSAADYAKAEGSGHLVQRVLDAVGVARVASELDPQRAQRRDGAIQLDGSELPQDRHGTILSVRSILGRAIVLIQEQDVGTPAVPD